jgi:hypothetical protein
MHDSQEHIFTDEFDDICIAISLNMGTAPASVQITFIERNRVWDELMLVSAHNAHHKDATDLRAFEGDL